ncbi:hypothetical protein ALP8811_01111 [Aliiroseovarius pelagivivens]|uniref:CENP-V/GFA domain-containing protein n=1 Tax=Aliiroseovarius pelagivivens TaxID=1639690 RepID=A0A2R8AJ96_9RHOB|nr:GFA family protein [Aliiroseovarius pelagivivens]SPF76111.1 hypothetical protein ALP8811_01111 [Aliiroseovarius pelagivivens]
MSDQTYHGSCFCGKVAFSVTGAPAGMGYCHCLSCRTWSAAPVNAFTLWEPASLTITAGEDQIATYCKTDQSHRKFCTSCGGHLMTDHPQMGLVDIYAAMLPDLDFQPALHVHYGEKVLSIPDGLTKFNDMPADLGGSGTELPD